MADIFSRTPVTITEIAEEFTLNGTSDVRRFDVRIASDGCIYTLRVMGEDRDGVVVYSDDRLSRSHAELKCGYAAQYYRNAFGVLLRNWTRENGELVAHDAF